MIKSVSNLSCFLSKLGKVGMHSFVLLPGPRDIIKEGVKRGNAAKRERERERECMSCKQMNTGRKNPLSLLFKIQRLVLDNNFIRKMTKTAIAIA